MSDDAARAGGANAETPGRRTRLRRVRPCRRRLCRRRMPVRPVPMGGKRYGFNCQYCSSRLETTEAPGRPGGRLPTCGNAIVHSDPRSVTGRLIDPMTGKVIKQDPHPSTPTRPPVSGRLGSSRRGGDGAQFILCPQVQNAEPDHANNCKNCGMPFTMEAPPLRPPARAMACRGKSRARHHRPAHVRDRDHLRPRADLRLIALAQTNKDNALAVAAWRSQGLRRAGVGVALLWRTSQGCCANAETSNLHYPWRS